MDFTENNTKKWMETDGSMATQEPVVWVYATDVELMAVLMMMLQMATLLCPTLTSHQSLPACTGMRSDPSDEEVAPPVSRETVIHIWHLHRMNDTTCQVAAMSL